MSNYVPQLNKFIIYKADLSEVGNTYIIQNEKGKHLKITEGIKLIIDEIDGIKSYSEIVQILKQKHQVEFSEEELKQLVIDELGSKGMIRDIEAKESNVRKSKLWFHLSLMDGSKLENIAKKFAILYKFPVSVIVITLIFLIAILSISNTGAFMYSFLSGRQKVNVGTNNFIGIVMLVILFISTLVHEFGHMVSCFHYGVKPRGIGIGLYLFMPVLFCDLTEAWVLERKKRVVIDLSGFYFELLFLVALFPLFTLNNSIFNINNYFLMINLALASIIFNLNPLLRLDGYWVLSDLLGTVNIHQRTQTSIIDTFRKITRSKKYNPQKNYELLPEYEKIFRVWSVMYVIITLVFLILGLMKLPDIIIGLYRKSPLTLILLPIFVLMPLILSKVRVHIKLNKDNRYK